MSTPANSIGALILAAGDGKRIGQPKIRLRYRDRYLLDFILSTLRNVDVTDVVVTVRERDVEWMRSEFPLTRIAINLSKSSAMFSSLLCGLPVLQHCSGVLIMPIDVPFVSASLLTELITTHLKSPETCIIPRYDDRSGHPVLLPQLMFDEIFSGTDEDRLDWIIRNSRISKTYVETNDSEIHRNVNTKFDLP